MFCCLELILHWPSIGSVAVWWDPAGPAVPAAPRHRGRGMPDPGPVQGSSCASVRVAKDRQQRHSWEVGVLSSSSHLLQVILFDKECWCVGRGRPEHREGGGSEIRADMSVAAAPRFVLVWVFVAAYCSLTLLCLRRESGRTGGRCVTESLGVQTDGDRTSLLHCVPWKMPVTNHLKHKSELLEVPVLRGCKRKPGGKQDCKSKTLPPPPKGLPPVFTFHIKMLCNLLLMDLEPWLLVF